MSRFARTPTSSCRVPSRRLPRGVTMLGLLVALLPAAAWADVGLGDCAARTGAKSRIINLCLDSLKGLGGLLGDGASAGAAAAVPGDGAGGTDPAGSGRTGWSISGSLVPNRSDAQPRDGLETSNADRLLDSLRLEQFMLRLNHPF
jgi:hypothetical protein